MKLRSLEESKRANYRALLPEIIQSHLKKRKLYPYEIKMLQQQRVCMVCLEDNPEKIKSCAGCPLACFCEEHEKDDFHSSYCSIFTHSCILDAYEASFLNETWKPVIETIAYEEKPNTLPYSMYEFVNSFYFTLRFYEDLKEYDLFILISEKLFTRSMTLLFAMVQLKRLPSTEMILHVIGANSAEEQYLEEWELLFHLLPDLIKLTVFLVGPELCVKRSKPHLCDICLVNEKDLSIETFIGEYKDFVGTEVFAVPNVIIGYEIRLDLYITWSESIRTVANVGCPFIFTSSTYERAYHDHQQMLHTFNRNMKYFYFGKNPFSSMRPRINPLEEKIYYYNAYLTIYEDLNSNESNSFDCSGLLKEIDHVHCEKKKTVMEECSDISEKTNSNSEKEKECDQTSKNLNEPSKSDENSKDSTG